MNKKGTGGKKYPDKIRKQAEERIKKGESVTKIADDMGIPQSAVSYWNVTLKKKLGCPPDARVADALVFLKVSRKDLMDALRAGKIKQPSRSDLHMLLALDALEGT